MYMFQIRSFWREMGVPQKKISDKFQYYFGEQCKKITDRPEAIKFLSDIIQKIQQEFLDKITKENTYGMLLKLCCIFNKVHSLYLLEKSARIELSKQNIHNEDIIDSFVVNRNIERDIIEACNIWIENCVLHQHNLNIQGISPRKEFTIDYELLIDVYVYGSVSRAMSLLTLSKSIGEKNTFYGLEILSDEDIPLEVLKYHPLTYYNTVIVGNQDTLVTTSLSRDANTSPFGKGFKAEHNVEFLLFLATIKSLQEGYLRGDDKSLRIFNKKEFIKIVESCTNPSINGENFYDAFVLTKEKITKHLRNKERIIWKIGTNKYRYELRPFIGLDDGNVILSYGGLEQAKQIWASYSSNGGMCYTDPIELDSLTKAMEIRNKELSDILVEKIREILNRHYEAKVDLKDVKYKRIFGQKSTDYGDYDVVYYAEKEKQLFLIESKYFSDSYNSSGMVSDYNKMFKDGGYYDHCRSRCDLALMESEKLKKFIGTNDDIDVHLLFISSKPIEMELTDSDGVVTMLSLGIFEKYIEGKLINGDDDTVIKTHHRI